jgi:hypothetical protein
MGAKRIRELFTTARKLKRAILFIDEIDTVQSQSRERRGRHFGRAKTVSRVRDSPSIRSPNPPASFVRTAALACSRATASSPPVRR